MSAANRLRLAAALLIIAVCLVGIGLCIAKIYRLETDPSEPYIGDTRGP